MVVTHDKDNKLFQLAADLVNQSSRNIFLTGKAGTGKTTFLKYIRENCPKKMVVAAPTGVAAINAGGVTLHSLFQLPFSPYVPGFDNSSADDRAVSRHNLISGLRLTSEKKKMLREIELLIIDEISMVRCDTLDAVDAILRYVRGRNAEIFGGVQVLFIGDMFQLPPVTKETEWKLLSEHYSGPYFFDSYAIREERPLYIEFDKIYRQSDQRFIRMLNQVRNNELDEEGLSILESRFHPDTRRSSNDGFIILTTHNETARLINSERLSQLDGKLYSFKAEIENDFPTTAFPADEILSLKPGAQVMFIRNDQDRSKRYFNGKIGTIARIDEGKIYVQCKEERDEIEVKREIWENIRYDLNKATRQIDSKVLGSFSQYPLRLAWAITIHKSQGLTFENAIIDAGQSFAAGHVYVALSRCTNLEGMILQSRVRQNSLFIDPRIVEFSKTGSSSDELEKELTAARKNYQLGLLLSLFDFKNPIQTANGLRLYLAENKTSFNPEAGPWINSLNERFGQLQDIALKFQVWLKNQFQLEVFPEQNDVLRERVRKASDHFIKELSISIEFILQSPGITDSWIHSKEYNESIKDIFFELNLKKYMMDVPGDMLDIASWYERKRSFICPGCSVNAYARVSGHRTASPHPVLYGLLKELRDSICDEKGQPIYMIAGSKALMEMTTYLPQSADELGQIAGFGRIKVEKYGHRFLDLIREYSEENNLHSSIGDKIPGGQRKDGGKKKDRANDTKSKTFALYKDGRSIAEIASIRELAIGTIEGHLTYYIERGEINIDELVTPDKRTKIEQLIRNTTLPGITSIKEQLGESISFTEIRWVKAALEFEKIGQA